jgi:hypothetical protein
MLSKDKESVMKNTAALEKFPEKHIKPYDGMSVTADVWAQAHDAHRLTERAHNLNFHGSGIICGLEVVANDPADQYVFISPGAAVDSAGNVIVLSEPVAYDFGDSAEGNLFLLLGHGEREVGGVQKDIKYLQYEFVIAARSSFPKRPAVELARVKRSDVNKAVLNAADVGHPRMDEIDLRYRKMVGPDTKRFVKVAVGCLGSDLKQITQAWDLLGRECSRSTSYRLIVDPMNALPEGLLDCDLAYLAAAGDLNADKETISALQDYLKTGKGLILEALDEAAEEGAQNLIGKLKRKVVPIKEASPILSSPFLFAAPPDGAKGNQVTLDKQLIYSTAGFGLAWTGKSNGVSMSRSDIRSVHEWGLNMISYCLSLR